MTRFAQIPISGSTVRGLGVVVLSAAAFIGSFMLVGSFVGHVLDDAKDAAKSTAVSRQNRIIKGGNATGVSNRQPEMVEPVEPTPSTVTHAITLPVTVIIAPRPQIKSPPSKHAAVSHSKETPYPQWVCKPPRDLMTGNGSVKECDWK